MGGGGPEGAQAAAARAIAHLADGGLSSSHRHDDCDDDDDDNNHLTVDHQRGGVCLVHEPAALRLYLAALAAAHPRDAAVQEETLCAVSLLATLDSRHLLRNLLTREPRASLRAAARAFASLCYISPRAALAGCRLFAAVARAGGGGSSQCNAAGEVLASDGAAAAAARALCRHPSCPDLQLSACEALRAAAAAAGPRSDAAGPRRAVLAALLPAGFRRRLRPRAARGAAEQAPGRPARAGGGLRAARRAVQRRRHGRAAVAARAARRAGRRSRRRRAGGRPCCSPWLWRWRGRTRTTRACRRPPAAAPSRPPARAPSGRAGSCRAWEACTSPRALLCGRLQCISTAAGAAPQAPHGVRGRGAPGADGFASRAARAPRVVVLLLHWRRRISLQERQLLPAGSTRRGVFAQQLGLLPVSYSECTILWRSSVSSGVACLAAPVPAVIVDADSSPRASRSAALMVRRRAASCVVG